MAKPSDEDREALRQYMESMVVPTQNLHEGIRSSHRAISQGHLSQTDRTHILQALRSRSALPGDLPNAIPPLAVESHERWIRWFQTAVEAGNLLATAIDHNDHVRFLQAQQLTSTLPDLKHEIISPEMEMWCLSDESLESPITPDEYEEMLQVRKSNDYPRKPSPAWDRWSTMSSRYLYQHPATVENEMWHEAAHIVVGHRLGWSVERIDRHLDGTPQATVPPPCEPPALPVIDYSTVAVAGYLAEEKAFGNAMPSQDHINLARQFRASEMSQGRAANPESNLAHVLEAEARAQAILDEHWETVERIAERALEGLPVERDELLRALRGVQQDRPNCGNSSRRLLNSNFATVQSNPRMKGKDRNQPCPCGSGQKLKKCCGRSGQIASSTKNLSSFGSPK